MKSKTIETAIRHTLAASTAERERARTRAAVVSALDSYGDAPAALERAIAARNASLAAQDDLKRVPAPRRTLAADIVTWAEEIAFTVARDIGGSYSGTTSHLIEWGGKAEACTCTTSGGNYSRSCKYHKLDATHIITLDPAGVALLVENEPLRTRSAADGLPLIALYPDGSAVWAKRGRGKTITSERGWIAGNASVCYHSTESLAHARAGFEGKHAAHLAELKRARLADKQARRARLVARLCGGIHATLADARALGYCEPGIRAFQSRHGIGDDATLPDLIRTGDPSAVRLALSIARNA